MCDLFKVAHFRRMITGTQQAWPLTFWQRMSARGILVDSGYAIFLERAHRSEGASGLDIQQRSWYGGIHIFSNLTNCEQTALCLVGILLIILAGSLRPEGDDIVTCRVVRLSQDLLCIDLDFCCECGSADLEVRYTSKALGPHLCPTYVQSKVECGRWENCPDTIADEGAVCHLNWGRLTQVSL